MCINDTKEGKKVRDMPWRQLSVAASRELRACELHSGSQIGKVEIWGFLIFDPYFGRSLGKVEEWDATDVSEWISDFISNYGMGMVAYSCWV